MTTSFTTHAAGQTILASDVNLIQTAVNTLEAAVPGSTPTVHGFKAWSFDPWVSTATTTINTGVVYAFGVYLPAQTITNCHCYVITGAATTHLAMGLYSAAGTLLSQTADKTSDGSSTGLKTYALGAAQAVASGYYYITLALTGSSPTFFSAAGTNAAILDALGPANPVHRIATSGTAYSTTLPSPIGTLTAAAKPLWVAVS